MLKLEQTITFTNIEVKKESHFLGVLTTKKMVTEIVKSLSYFLPVKRNMKINRDKIKTHVGNF